MLAFLKEEPSADGKKGSRTRLLLIAGGAILGILLLLLGSGALQGDDTDSLEGSVYSAEAEELLAYQAHLEERVRALCESVRGVGSVTAIISLENGFESVYATEPADGAEQYVIVGSGSSAQALLLSRHTPEIRGIGIVCTGGDDPTVRQALQSLLSATFHISTTRIFITSAR